MTQPTAYTRQYNFTDFQTTNPNAPLPGAQVDAELNAVKVTSDQTRVNLGVIQRDDTKLRNQSVHKDAFDLDALALIGLDGFNPKGNWAAATVYAPQDLVNYNNATYLALIAHTATSVFPTDLAANKWILIANAAIGDVSSAVDYYTGNGSTTAFTLTYSYASNTGVQVYVNGVLQLPIVGATPGDYSLSGTTLTFVTAPAAPSVAGRKNVVVWGANVTVQANVNAAQTAASNASGYATAAAASASSAAASAATATTQATNAANSAASVTNSATTATAQAVIATTQATTATNQATIATNQATTATTQASAASASATTATNQATTATTQATNAASSASAASTSAANASTSATNANTAKVAAEAARDATLAAYDSFDDRYLGSKTSDPTLDNDGNALLAGSLYYNSVAQVMRIYTGSAWVAAYVSGTGLLAAANNLSDVADAPTARANLGITTPPLIEFNETITTNYVVTASKTALAVGPITINTGASVTVGTGQRWVILNLI